MPNNNREGRIAITVINTLESLMRGLNRHLDGWTYTGELRLGYDFVERAEIIVIPKRPYPVLKDYLDKHCQYVVQRSETEFQFKYASIPVTMFIAGKQNFVAMNLIKTGPREFTEKIVMAARRAGVNLGSDGFYDGGRIIIPEFESLIFEKLGLPYLRPQDRADYRTSTPEYTPSPEDEIVNQRIGDLL